MISKTYFSLSTILPFLQRKYIHTLLKCIGGLLFLIDPLSVYGANRYAVASNNWNSTSTWSETSGGAGGASIPVEGDNVFIGENGTAFTVTIPSNYAASCSNLSLGDGGNSTAAILIFEAITSALLVSGNAVMYRPSGNTTSIIDIGTGTMTVVGDLELSNHTGPSNSGTRINRIDISTGILNINGDLIFSAEQAAQGQIIFSGAGTMNIAGNMLGAVGTLTPGTSTINFNGTAIAQIIRIGVSAIYYHNLTINNTFVGGATVSSAITAVRVSGHLSVQSGTFNNSGFSIVLASTKNFSVANGATFNLTGTSTMVSVSGGGTKTFGTASTTRYSGAAQTVSAESYGNLVLSSTTTSNKTFAAATTIAQNLAISGLAVAILPNGSTSTALTVTLGGVNQTTGSWGGTASSATNKSATWFGTTTTGILNVNTGCTNGTWLGTFNTNWHDAGNWCGGIPTAITDVMIPATAINQPLISATALARNLSINSSATLTISGAYTFTVSGNWANSGTFTQGTSTVNFNRASGTQTLNNGSSQFYNLTHGGAGTLQLLSNDIIVNNNLTNAAGTLNANSLNISLKGNWTNNASFASGTGTVIFNGSTAQSINGTTATVFNSLTINNTSGVISGVNFTVNGILNLQSSNPSSSIGTLTMGTYTLSMGGSATTTGAGDVTGIVKRSNFVAGLLYSFGNTYTTVLFQNSGTLPADLSIKTTIGSVAAWKTDGILRTYEVIQNGAAGGGVTLNVHYLDSELNGNNENDLVYWYNSFPFAPGSEVEIGKSNYDLTNNWVGLSSIPTFQLPSGFGQLESTLGNSELSNYTWNGSIDTSWLNPANWTPNGTPSSNDDVIIPDANTTPNDPILPVGLWTIGRITIQDGGILNSTTSSIFEISGAGGAWINIGGTLNSSTGTVRFSSDAATMAGSTDFYNVTINAGATLTLGEGTIMRVAGVITNNGIWQVAHFNNSFVEYNGEDQIILNPNGANPGYHNLILSGSGTKTMPATALAIHKNFTLSGTATTTASATMDIGGNFNLGAGTTFSAATYSHFLGGNFTNNGGNFNANTSTFTLDGTTVQTLGGTTASEFGNLVINNSAGVLLAIDEGVTSTLTFINGIITTGTNSLTIINASTNAIVGASSTNYVNGNLCRDIFAGANTYDFPIGTISAYAPVTMNFLVGTTAGSLCGSTTNGDHPNFSSSTFAPMSSVNRHWSFVINSGLTTANYNATYNWVTADQDPLFNFATAIVGLFTPSTWDYPAIDTRTASNIRITGVTAFGDYQVANGCTPYDASISGATAICDGSSSNLVVTLSGGISPYTVVYTGGGGGTVTNYISGSNIPVIPVGTTSYTLTSVTDAGGCMATITGSPTATITVNPSGTWVGTTSTDWNTASNWCGGIPTASTDVIITSAPVNQPIIGVAGGLSRNITIGSDATLTITGTNTLTISGSWMRTGTFVANSSTVNFNGSETGNISASNFHNITFSGAGTKTATGVLTIAGNVSITNNFTAGAFTHSVGGNWTNTGTFNATSSTIDFNGSNAGSIGAGNFNNIIFSGAGIKTGTGALTIAGDLIISNNYSGTSGALTLFGDWTNNGTFTTGAGTILFSGTSSQAINGTSVSTFTNFTINNPSGVIAAINVVVNGVLNLQSSNPSSTSGTLAMGTNTLTMGGSATTIGLGDVTGIVTRTSFVPGVAYTFGHQYTTIIFQNVGTLPTEVSLRIAIGVSPVWKTSAIQRTYAIIQTGAVNNLANLNAHYLDSELNGNVENTLVLWRATFPFTPGTGVEFGRSNFDVTNNWISLSSIPFNLLPSTFGQWEGSMASSELPGSTWNGSVSTTWVDPANWTPYGVPSDLTDVIIPDAVTTPNDPTTRIDGTVIKTLTIQSGGILNAELASMITLNGGAGAWSNIGGTFNASTSTVIFTNAASTIAGVTDFYNVTIHPNAGLSNQIASITRISGTMTNNGTWHAVQNPDNTVEYNGGNQTLLNPNGTIPGYYHLILSGSGIKTMPDSALPIHGDFTTAGTAAATAGSALTIKGGVTLGSGTAFTTSSFNHAIGGNFTNNGATFNATGSTITFNGLTEQTIGGSISSTFNNLTVNNSAGAVLGTSETVFGILTLTNGIISTGTNTLRVNNVSTTAIVGASPTNYINGNLHRDIAAGINTYLYPLGTSTAYAPVSISFTAGTVAGELTGTTIDGDHPNIASSTLAPMSSVNRFWRFTINSGLSTVIYGATFNWVMADEDSLFDYSTAMAGNFNTPSSWGYPTIDTRTETSISITAASDFGDFQVANGCTSFTAILSGPAAICDGSTDNLVVTITGGISPYTVVYSGNGEVIVVDYISGTDIPISPSEETTYTLISVTDAGGCTGTVSGSPTVTTTLTPTGTWLGTTSTDWHTASNWCGGVPTATTDINIPAGGNQPVIVAAAFSRNLSINIGATLTITGTNTVTVFGTWTRAGTFIANSSTVIFDGDQGNIGTSNFYNIQFISPAVQRASGVLTIEGNVIIDNNFSAGAYTHTVGGNWTNNGTFSSDAGTIIFNGASPQTIEGDSISSFNNLTLNNASGVIANSDLSVNGVLNLQSANPSISIGNLTLGAQTLTLDGSATTIGIGDVTGIVKRTSFISYVIYTFGNRYTTAAFGSSGTLPTEFSVKTTIGAAPDWKSDGILRIYDVIQYGAIGGSVTINVHYLDVELNGNLENDLVYWYNQYPFTPGTQVEIGKSDFDLTNNWVGLSSIPTGALPTGFGQLESTLGGSELANYTWNGSVDSIWITPLNWTPNGVPSSFDDVIIPDAATTPNDPTLPVDAWSIGRMTIENGGILNANPTSIFTISGGGGAWINAGGIFNASTSEVIFTGAAATLSGTTDFYDVTIAIGAELRLNDGAVMRIAGMLITNEALRAVGPGTTTVEYNGGDQIVVIPNPSTHRYDNLILSGSGIKTMPTTALDIDDSFTMSGTASATASATIDIDSSFTLNAGTMFRTGAFNHTLGGNFTNNGATFNAMGSNITLDGVTQQTFGGVMASTFDDLTIDNTAGILLTNIETISGKLVFINGIITTEEHSLYITNSSPGALSGFSSSSYVNGNLCLSILAGENIYFLPIGTANAYVPVTVEFLNGTAAGTLCTSSTNGDHDEISSSDLNAHNSVNRIWTLTVDSGLETVVYDATFNWIKSDEDLDFDWNQAVIGKYSGSEWSYPSVGTRTVFSTQITDLTSFSEFQVAEACIDPDVPTVLASPGSPVCVGTAVTLTIATGLLNDATDWQWYADSCGGISVGSGISIIATPTSTTTYYVRGEGGCPALGTCATITITVDEQPAVSNQPNQAMCNTTTFTMTQTAPTIGTGEWTLILGNAIITTPNSPTTTITGVNPEEVTLRWTVTNGTCSAFDDVTLQNDILPVVSNQPDQSLCNTSIFTMTQSLPSDGDGQWTLISGDAAITDSDDPMTTITGVLAGTSAILRWTVVSETCTVFDDVEVQNDELPVVTDQPNQSACNSTTFTMTQNTPTVGIGVWTLISGTATITSPGSPITTITDVAEGTSATIKWTVTNGTCSAFDEVTITNNFLPVCSITGDTTVCPTSSNDYSAPASVSYAWSSSLGGTITSATDIQTITIMADAGCNTSFTLTVTVTDVNGCTSSCMETVSVVDQIAPVVTGTIEETTVQGCEAGDATAAVNTVEDLELIGLTIDDACIADGSLVVSSSDVSTGTCPIVVTRTYTVTDACLNFTTVEQTINVDDSTAPTITCPIDVSVNTDAGQCTALGVSLGVPITGDNCGVMSVTNDAPMVFPTGNTDVIWTVTDSCGLIATCTQVVSVTDSQVPSITCPLDIVTGTDNGECSAVVSDIDATFSDNCPGSTVVFVLTGATLGSGVDDASGLTFNAGVTTVTYTVSDAGGLTADCEFTVTVNDDENPTINSCPVTRNFEGCDVSAITGPVFSITTANSSIVEFEDGNNLGDITDDCSGLLEVEYIDEVTNVGCPIEVTRTWTITDLEGNQATCDQIILIQDTTPPDITAGTIEPCYETFALAEAAALDATSGSDNCSIVLEYVVSTEGSMACDSVIVVTVTDECGNSNFVSYNTRVNCEKLHVYALLEGPFEANTGSINTLLNDYHLLPGQDPMLADNPLAVDIGEAAPHGQPYNIPPWNYMGTEGDIYGDSNGDTPYPITVTDWILVSIREADSLASSEIWKCAALLPADGEIEIPDACPCIPLTDGTDYYIVLEHRNHLPVMSTKLEVSNGDLTFDFRQNQSWIYGGGSPFGFGQKLIDDTYVLYAGNGEQINSRVEVTSSDESQWLLDNGTLFQYQAGDYDMNGHVDAVDEFIWLINNSVFTFMPF